jgi:xylulokinase
MDPSARGSFVGLRASHGAAELARAVVEGIAFSLHEALAAVAVGSDRPAEILLGGGGARHPLWSRLLADSFGLPVRTLAVADLSAYGAAMLAAHHLGWVDVFDPSHEWRRMDDAVEPDLVLHRFYRERFEIAGEIFRLTHPLSRLLAELNLPSQARR